MDKEIKLNDLMDNLADVRDKMRSLQEQEKVLRIRRNDLESAIIGKMDEQGIDQIANNLCTISKKLEIVPTVEDWDILYKHILRTKQFELLQKRMSATAYRELLQMNTPVPGVKATELTKINYRSK